MSITAKEMFDKYVYHIVTIKIGDSKYEECIISGYKGGAIQLDGTKRYFKKPSEILKTNILE